VNAWRDEVGSVAPTIRVTRHEARRSNPGVAARSTSSRVTG